jgi:septal ring factor EnvC (AmiA/AmiB activator)
MGVRARVLYSRPIIVKPFLKRLLVGLGGSAPPKPAEAREPKIDWKAKAAEAIERAHAAEREARHRAKAAEKLEALVEKLRRRDLELQKLREQLAVVERELTAAREQLMVVEVKLDILEGAANVLDARTRTATLQQPRETGAAV